MRRVLALLAVVAAVQAVMLPGVLQFGGNGYATYAMVCGRLGCGEFNEDFNRLAGVSQCFAGSGPHYDNANSSISLRQVGWHYLLCWRGGQRFLHSGAAERKTRLSRVAGVHSGAIRAWFDYFFQHET